MTDQLAGKVAIVTGAGIHSGIGRGVAERFYKEGAKLVVADLKGSQELAEVLGKNAVGVTVDVTSPDDIAAMVKAALDNFGRLDILVNVAGVEFMTRPMVDIPLDGFQKTIDINLTGTFLAMKAAIPPMIANGGGSIVNFSSAAANKSMPLLSAYAAAKAGVIALTRTVCNEVGKQGVRINSITPAAIDTPMSHTRPELAEMLDAFGKATPLGRTGSTAEMAAAVLFLASDEASYITGVNLPVGGGYEAL